MGGARKLTVRVDDELGRRIDHFAAGNGLTESEAVRQVLVLGLEQSGSPVSVAALGLQSRVCAQLTREHAEYQRRAMVVLRRLVAPAHG